MEYILKGIEPKRVFEIFEDITKIPHGSGNEKQLAKYIEKFAKKENLEVTLDELYNVIIKKEAGQGYENAPSLILQGHIDMVCEKDVDTEIDFLNDSLEIYIDRDYVKAKRTTLGADNGIGVAMILAVLELNIPLPKIEAIFTVEEETTMNGAKNIDLTNINSKMLLSLDSIQEGEIIVSSAGIKSIKIGLDVRYEEIELDYTPFNIQVTGLIGGHSGGDINLGRGNSNCILARILNELDSSIGIRLVKISGGQKANAIPRDSDCIIYIQKDKEKELEEVLNILEVTLKEEYKESDKDIQIKYSKANVKDSKVFDNSSAKKLLEFLLTSPNGVQTMSNEIEGLVESSLNIGVINTESDKVNIEITIRSSDKKVGEDIINRLKNITKYLNMNLRVIDSSPAMEYKEKSKLRDICKKTYKEITKEELKVSATHGGLEGGIFADKIPGLDIALIAPNIYDIHSPKERVSISSVERVYKYLIEVLKNIK